MRVIIDKDIPWQGKDLKIGDEIEIDDRRGNRWIRNKICHKLEEKLEQIKQCDSTSIIMLSKDCLDYTKKCLDSLAQYTRNFELIVIDNGSNEETLTYLKNLKRFKEYKLVLNNKNVGVPYAWDQGVKLAKYDYIAIINNDVVFTPDWLNQLQRCFNDNPLCSVASPTTSFSNGIQCDWSIAPKRFEWTQKDMNNYARSLKFEYIETEIYGFAFLTHKKVIDKIGVFDYKRYGMGSCEEKDFNWRSRQVGFKTYWVKHCYIHHYGHMTYEEGNIGINVYKLCEQSRVKFNDRIINDKNLFVKNDVEVEVTELKQEFSSVIDVIIPVLDRKEQTIQTLNVLFANNDNINVIIVDNGSDDLSYLKKFKVKIVKNKTNLGVIKALNQGLILTKSKYFVVMHNDLIFNTKDWISKAIDYMENDATIGIVGVSGWTEIQDHGEYLPKNVVSSIDKYSNNKPKGDFEEVVITDGCCNVIRNIGLTYDENYGFMHFYDTDMAMQYKTLGYDIFVIKGNAKHLAEDRTISTSENIKYKVLINKKDLDYYYERQDLFVNKWKDFLPLKFAPIPIKMITWNRLAYTKKAINSILTNTDYPFLLWIYDNNSADGTQEYLRGLTDPRIQVTYSDTNTGLIPPFNIFMEQFKDVKYICQVDNDCVMPKGWLSKFKYTMDNLPIFSLSGDHFLGIPYRIKENREFYDHLETIDFLGDKIYLFSHAGMGNMVRRKWLDKPVEVVGGNLGGWVKYQTDKWWFEAKTCAFHSGVWINLLDMQATNTPRYDYPEYRQQTNMMRSGTINDSGFGTKDLSLRELEEIRGRVQRRWQNQIENKQVFDIIKDFKEEKQIKEIKLVKLDLGCGPFKKEGYIGIDMYDHSKKYSKEEFIQGKIPEILSTFLDNSVDEIQATHFIEHIQQAKVIETFNEIYRILKIGGIFEVRVPPSTGRGAYCDPTHVSFWNNMSFRYYDMTWCRELSESYGIKCDFEIVENKVTDEFNLHTILRKRG